MVNSAQSVKQDLGVLIYVHDPMCSWCWALRPQLDLLLHSLPNDFRIMRLLGGLAPDSNEPMPETMRRHLQEVWRNITHIVPGTKFNFDFWRNCIPRRSTYPACRAVIAARNQGDEWDEKMTKSIQKAYYLEARNPSDNQTLIEIAETIGLNVERFTDELDSQQTQRTLLDEIRLSREMGISGFPSMMLKRGNQLNYLPVDYTNHLSTLEAIKSNLDLS
ncbi:MAG: DsbA family protein [Gammaproteobacteria bacterium]|nr:DsbA family protein [Gammaproteobacteria bacterium]MCY4217909.1 DsbA family protein [Gammaproteobacteria bacterium]MCY4275232.1 DsbA family protein [Gammaproteobacteria bacterium]